MNGSKFARNQSSLKACRLVLLVCLLAFAAALAGCGSDSTVASSDANDKFPYLTAQPTASPSTAVDGDTVSFTVFATGPLGLGTVFANLAPVTEGTGFPAQASATLTETGTDTWTGAGTIDASGGIVVGGEGYSLTIQLIVDPSGVDQTATFYTRATSGTSLTYSRLDSAFVEVETGLSAYSVVIVTLQ